MKYRTPVILLLTGLVASITTVVILYAMSDYVRNRPGSFYRVFPPHPVIEVYTKGVSLNGYKIIGIASNLFYLWSANKPLEILELDYTLNHITMNEVSIESSHLVQYHNIVASVQGPYFFIADGTVPYIYRGEIGTWSAKRFMYDSTYFLDMVPISKASFVLRSVAADKSKCVLIRQSRSQPHVIVNDELLEKQIDGFFCTDGMLNYNQKLNNIIYVYYYRNQYLVIDANLDLRYKGTTIDTFSIARVQTSVIRNGNYLSNRLSTPPPEVNKHSCVYEDWLFVHSKVLSRNEDAKLFAKASTIDVYDLNENMYMFSFYIYDRFNEKMRDFRVMDGRLVAIFDNSVLVCELNKTLFKR